MTKMEAMERLDMYERMCCRDPGVGWSKYEFKRACYQKSILPFVRERIEHGMLDPLTEIHGLKMELDDRIGDSDNARTWEFCSIVCDILSDILDFIA